MDLLSEDRCRYPGGRMPRVQRYFRLAGRGGLFKLIYKPLFIIERNKRNIDLAVEANIGGGLYLGHPSGFTINSHAVIGRNCSIHKGVLIGRENRGERSGVPTIGDEVWIGINAAIVGKINIGNDVLIAPNSYVNFDVPDHSIVFGNPAVIKHRDHATEGYINNKAD